MEGNGHIQTPRLKDGTSALTEWIMNSIADTKFSHATLTSNTASTDSSNSLRKKMTTYSNRPLSSTNLCSKKMFYGLKRWLD